MKLAVVGSRGFSDKARLYAELEKFSGISLIISGGAKGADQLAEEYARERNIPVKIFMPDWAKYKRAAGPMRNKLIVQESECVIAFWDGVSAGTKSSIDFAKKENKTLHIVRF